MSQDAPGVSSFAKGQIEKNSHTSFAAHSLRRSMVGVLEASLPWAGAVYRIHTINVEFSIVLDHAVLLHHSHSFESSPDKLQNAQKRSTLQLCRRHFMAYISSSIGA